MELSIMERLLLLNLLPAEGDLITIRIVRKLRESLSFSEEEIAQFDIKVQPDGQVRWTDAAYTKTIELGAKARELLVSSLEKLDRVHKVEEKHLPLFDKFGVGLD